LGEAIQFDDDTLRGEKNDVAFADYAYNVAITQAIYGNNAPVIVFIFPFYPNRITDLIVTQN